jgi:hypothetical protein
MVGYYALLACDMDAGVGAIMMVNGLGEREPVVRYALSVLRAWKEGADLPEVPPAPDPYAVPDADAIAGRYRSGGRELHLRADGTHLVWAADDGDVALEPDPETPGSFAVPHPSMDRHALTLDHAGGRVSALLAGPARYVRDGEPEAEDVPPPPGSERITGLYRAYNPWFPAFRVYVRAGELFLSAGDGELRMEEVGEGEFRVGEPWSPDRVGFGTIVDGRAQVATYNAHAFWRSFEE